MNCFHYLIVIHASTVNEEFKNIMWAKQHKLSLEEIFRIIKTEETFIYNRKEM